MTAIVQAVQCNESLNLIIMFHLLYNESYLWMINTVQTVQLQLF